MWSLGVGITGLLIVYLFGSTAVRGSKTSDERMFHQGHNSSFGLFFVCFYLAPGILALLNVMDDPLEGTAGPQLGRVTAGVGIVGALVLAAAGAIVPRLNRTPAKRGVLTQLWVYSAFTWFAFFALPGLLAAWRVIPDAKPGLGLAADTLAFFFLHRWAHRRLVEIAPAETDRPVAEEHVEVR